MTQKRTQLAASNLSTPIDRARAEQRDRQRVHGREQRAEPRVDDAGGEEQLERVGRNPEQVQQERNRGVDVAEQRQQPVAASRG